MDIPRFLGVDRNENRGSCAIEKNENTTALLFQKYFVILNDEKNNFIFVWISVNAKWICPKTNSSTK
jgi:hypothetical protein